MPPKVGHLGGAYFYEFMKIHKRLEKHTLM